MNIKYYRMRSKMTIKELAEKSGLAISYVCNLENENAVNPSRETMTKISNALGESIPEIFFSAKKED